MSPSFQVHRFDDVVAFRRRVDPYLLAREAEHALLLAIVTWLQAGGRPQGKPLLITVENGDEVAAVALRTPPFNLLLSQAGTGAVEALADGLAAEPLPGVNGPRAEAEAFARRYGTMHDRVAREVMALGLYRLDAVIEPPRPAGRPRLLEERDRTVVEGWIDAFQREAHVGAASDPSEVVDASLRGELRGMEVWEAEGALVSLAGWSLATPGSARVGPVYTPPALRGKGYASALVAELSRRRLELGARFCTLYADLANPTSNGIYLRIGYRHLLDAVELVFEPAS